MHFHLPKPLHGWRQFLGEVGIIVIGVLIALAAEQAVESAHLRSETNALRASMHDELADDLGRWEVMHSQQPCLENWLSKLSAWSDSAPPGARWPIQSGGPNFFHAHVSTWELARGSAAVAGMPLRERDQLADLYQVLEYAELDGRQVSADWQTAFLLAAAGGADNRRALPLAVMKARLSVDQLMADYASLTPRFAALGIHRNYRGVSLSGGAQRCVPSATR